MRIKKLITAQDSGDNLTRYFAEIRGYESLTKEQEIALIKRIQKHNDQKALDTLIKANLKFVVSIAKQYQGQGASILDLVSEGNGGLLEAVGRFNINQNIKFFSYAVWWIRIRMFTHLYNCDRHISLPANRALLVTKIKGVVDQLEKDLHRYPTLDELYVYCKKKHSKSDIQEAITFGSKTTSLQDQVGLEEDSLTLEEVTQGDLQIDSIDRNNSLIDDLNRFLFHLTQCEYDILCFAIGLNNEQTFRNSDIAKLLNIKEKDVVRLKSRALKRMKKLKNIGSLKDYL